MIAFIQSAAETPAAQPDTTVLRIVCGVLLVIIVAVIIIRRKKKKKSADNEF